MYTSDRTLKGWVMPETQNTYIGGDFDTPNGTLVMFLLYVMQSSVESWVDQKDVLKSALSCIVV